MSISCTTHLQEEDCNCHVFGLPVDELAAAVSKGPDCLASLSSAIKHCGAQAKQGPEELRQTWADMSKRLLLHQELITVRGESC